MHIWPRPRTARPSCSAASPVIRGLWLQSRSVMVVFAPSDGWIPSRQAATTAAEATPSCRPDRSIRSTVRRRAASAMRFAKDPGSWPDAFDWPMSAPPMAPPRLPPPLRVRPPPLASRATAPCCSFPLAALGDPPRGDIPLGGPPWGDPPLGDPPLGDPPAIKAPPTPASADVFGGSGSLPRSSLMGRP